MTNIPRQVASLNEMQAKVREVFTHEDWPESAKELLCETLIQESYFRGRMDCANDSLEEIRATAPNTRANS